jgi:hypothetical protein
MVTAATAVENGPVYSIPVDVNRYIYSSMRTHENEDSISVLLPALDHLVLFL